MKDLRIAAAFLVVFGMSFPGFAEDKAAVAPSSAAPDKPVMMDEVYPGLASAVLTCARLVDLPEGTLLRAGELVIKASRVSEQIDQAPKPVQTQLRKNALFVLEQIATRELLLMEATAHAAKAGTDVTESSERDIMEKYFRALVEKTAVTDREVAEFFRDNSEMFQGAGLDDVRPQLKQYLLQQKQTEAVNLHVRTLGQRVRIELSAAWVRTQAVQAMDNPVDRARRSGRPSLVDFGRGGCGPCDMMTPLLEQLTEKYGGKANVLFVHVGEQPILAARYGIRSIPEQVFFDKDGREVFRHTGFFPKDKIEKKLSEMGVK